MGANLPYEMSGLLDYVRLYRCGDDLMFVRGRLECFENRLKTIKDLLKVT